MTLTNQIDWLRKDPNHIENIGISQTAGTTFTVNSASGAAFSSRNAGYVAIDSLAVPGVKKLYRITANQSFTQANIATNNFGLTNGIALASDVPFFLYAVTNAAAGSPETTVTFMVSRFPNSNVSPIAGKIGKAGSAVANSQGSFFALDSSITVADFASSPCISLGSFRMQWSAGNNWTITTLGAQDGIGHYQEGKVFLSAVNQFGAAAASFFYANGGTAPQFGSPGQGYFINRNNFMMLSVAFQNCTVAGLGAVVAQYALPFILTNTSSLGSGFLSLSSVPQTIVFNCSLVSPGPNNKMVFNIPNAGVANFQLLNSNFVVDATYGFTAAANGLIDFS